MHILFDTSATHSFMSLECLDRLGLVTTEGVEYVVGLPDGSKVRVSCELLQCPLGIGNRDWLADFIVMKLSER